MPEKKLSSLQIGHYPFWQAESYDHLVRNDAGYERVKAYILHNPVKAGLMAGRELWPFSFSVE